MRTFILVFLMSGTLPAQAADLSPSAWLGKGVQVDVQTRLTRLLHPGPSVIDAACCKVCRKGLAGGDTCISRDKTCQSPPGCGCQGQ